MIVMALINFKTVSYAYTALVNYSDCSVSVMHRWTENVKKCIYHQSYTVVVHLITEGEHGLAVNHTHRTT